MRLGLLLSGKYLSPFNCVVTIFSNLFAHSLVSLCLLIWNGLYSIILDLLVVVIS
jgi:hypothetical protein